jgi:hypothetical protein
MNTFTESEQHNDDDDMLSDIAQLKRKYEQFARTLPIGKHDVQSIQQMPEYQLNRIEYDYVVTTYMSFVEDLYYTTDEKKICDIGELLNESEGFNLMLNVLYVLRFIMESKSNEITNDDFFDHTRVIEMTWDGIGRWCS